MALSEQRPSSRQRYLIGGGGLMSLSGIATFPPVIMARFEQQGLSGMGMAAGAVGLAMIVVGLLFIRQGRHSGAGEKMPSAVRMAVTGIAILAAFFALELCDRLVRQDGRIFYWSTFLLPPVLLLYAGLLARQRWAWWISRAFTGLAMLWFGGFMAIVPFAHLETDGVPAPWYGRVYVAAVSLAFAAIFALAWRSLARPETRAYFGINSPAKLHAD
jgi:hypothetical protein